VSEGSGLCGKLRAAPRQHLGRHHRHLVGRERHVQRVARQHFGGEEDERREQEQRDE